MKHRGNTLGGKCGTSCTGGGGGIHQVASHEAPQCVCDATATWVQSYAPKGGRPTKHTKWGLRWWSLSPMPPPPLRVRPPLPPPSRRRWLRWRPSPPPPQALDVGALEAGAATYVTDACQTLVEQTAAMGVEAAPGQGSGGPPQVGLVEDREGAEHHSACPGTGPELGHQEGGGG